MRSLRNPGHRLQLLCNAPNSENTPTNPVRVPLSVKLRRYPLGGNISSAKIAKRDIISAWNKCTYAQKHLILNTLLCFKTNHQIENSSNRTWSYSWTCSWILSPTERSGIWRSGATTRNNYDPHPVFFFPSSNEITNSCGLQRGHGHTCESARHARV